MVLDRIAGLSAGADDYMAKPFDTAELLARVAAILRRAKQLCDVSPSTGLPGNGRIIEEVIRRQKLDGDYSLCYIDIDPFKSVVDTYGPLRGETFLVALGSALSTAAARVGQPSPFVGHIGGDDFIVICTPAQVLPLASRAVLEFEAAADLLYDTSDAARGYVEIRGPSSDLQHAQLVTLSIGVAQVTHGVKPSPHELIKYASEMKAVAKTQPGSFVAIDRRST